MKRLVVILLLGTSFRGYAEELRPQYRTWKSSEISCGNYSNVLISSTPILFHVVTGSSALNQSGNQYFSFFWSTAQPPATDMSTKAFVYTNQSSQERNNLGNVYDVFTSTAYGFHVYSYFSKVGGACPLDYLWDYYLMPPERISNNFFPKD